MQSFDNSKLLLDGNSEKLFPIKPSKEVSKIVTIAVKCQKKIIFMKSIALNKSSLVKVLTFIISKENLLLSDYYGEQR